MKKINKRSVLSVVLCAMLVFCAGFYSSAQPTTAWFSDIGDTSGDFVMEELYVDFTGEGIGEGASKLALSFDAATRFADADERSKMFEHAAKYYMFTAENTGTLSAHVMVEINDSQTQDDIMTAAEIDKGLRYFIYEVNTTADLVANGEEFVEGVFTDENGNCLVKSGNEYYDSKLADKLDEKISAATDVDFTDEAQQLAFLNECHEDFGELKPGEKRTYCICFWVEYTPFINNSTNAINEANGISIRTMDFDVDVKLSAEQFFNVEIEQN